MTRSALTCAREGLKLLRWLSSDKSVLTDSRQHLAPLRCTSRLAPLPSPDADSREIMAVKVEPFWMHKTLSQLDPVEWESLCDGCGLCCLQKLEDEDDGGVYYTRIACKLLDLKTCQCSDYPNRRALVPDCIQLTPGQADEFKWLPPTCGYRLVSEGKDLPLWHHLVCGDRDQVHKQRISQSGRMLSEKSVAEDDWEDYLIFRAG